MKTAELLEKAPLANPKAGTFAYDPTFKSRIWRLTAADIMDDHVWDDGRKLWACQSEYATITPYNSDASRLLLQHASYFALYSGAGTYLRDCAIDGRYELTPSSEPRWSATDPNRFYYVNGRKLKFLDVEPWRATVLHEFLEYVDFDEDGRNGIGGMGEGDLSEDGQYWAMRGLRQDGKVDIFMYDLRNEIKGPALTIDFNRTPVNQLYATPDSNLLIGFSNEGQGAGRGLWLYTRQMEPVRQIAPVLAHMDVCRNAAGVECIAAAGQIAETYCNAAGLVCIPLAEPDNAKCILAHDWNLASHVYGPARPGQVVFSTFLNPPDKPWVPYAGEIMIVDLDGGGAERIAHHRSTHRSATAQPRATGSRDLSKILFNSNWGQPSRPSDYADVYTVEWTAPKPEPDPKPVTPPAAVLNKFDFAGMEGQRYLLEVLPNGLLSMTDLGRAGAGGGRTYVLQLQPGGVLASQEIRPVPAIDYSARIGDRWILVGAKGSDGVAGLEMYEEKKP